MVCFYHNLLLAFRGDKRHATCIDKKNALWIFHWKAWWQKDDYIKCIICDAVPWTAPTRRRISDANMMPNSSVWAAGNKMRSRIAKATIQAWQTIPMIVCVTVTVFAPCHHRATIADGRMWHCSSSSGNTKNHISHNWVIWWINSLWRS